MNQLSDKGHKGRLCSDEGEINGHVTINEKWKLPGTLHRLEGIRPMQTNCNNLLKKSFVNSEILNISFCLQSSWFSNVFSSGAPSLEPRSFYCMIYSYFFCSIACLLASLALHYAICLNIFNFMTPSEDPLPPPIPSGGFTFYHICLLYSIYCYCCCLCLFDRLLRRHLCWLCTQVFVFLWIPFFFKSLNVID